MLSLNPVKPDVIYHAPVFEPTVDELAMLKTLELGQTMSTADALHVSKRLFERGMIEPHDGGIAITAQGLALIRRTE